MYLVKSYRDKCCNMCCFGISVQYVFITIAHSEFVLIGGKFYSIYGSFLFYSLLLYCIMFMHIVNTVICIVYTGI